MKFPVRTLNLVLPRKSGIPIHVEIVAEVCQPTLGRFNPHDGGAAPEPGEVNYRRVSWKLGKTPQEGAVEELLADWKGEAADLEAAQLELDTLVLDHDALMPDGDR